MHRLTGKIDENLGPVVDVVLCVTRAREEALQKAGRAVPARITNLRALIDTGSDRLAIDSEHAGLLGLPVRARDKVRTVDQIKYPTLFEVGVRIDFGDRELMFEVQGCCFNGLKHGNEIDMIIGRDILEAFVFHYDGPGKTFTLTCQ